MKEITDFPELGPEIDIPVFIQTIISLLKKKKEFHSYSFSSVSETAALIISKNLIQVFQVNHNFNHLDSTTKILGV